MSIMALGQCGLAWAIEQMTVEGKSGALTLNSSEVSCLLSSDQRKYSSLSRSPNNKGGPLSLSCTQVEVVTLRNSTSSPAELTSLS